jgi:hypothetical protein
MNVPARLRHLLNRDDTAATDLAQIARDAGFLLTAGALLEWSDPESTVQLDPEILKIIRDYCSGRYARATVDGKSRMIKIVPTADPTVLETSGRPEPVAPWDIKPRAYVSPAPAKAAMPKPKAVGD